MWLLGSSSPVHHHQAIHQQHMQRLYDAGWWRNNADYTPVHVPAGPNTAVRVAEKPWRTAVRVAAACNTDLGMVAIAKCILQGGAVCSPLT